MLAIALVLDGVSRADAARLCGMDRQTLRDWIHRYDAAGIAGLSDRREGRGRKPSLTPEQAAEVAALVRAGPDLAEHGVVRRRRADLARVIEQRFGVRLDERTVGRGCCAGSASSACRCARAIHGPTRKPRPRIKNFRRAGCRRHPRARARQADRALVAR
jgi:transposase